MSTYAGMKTKTVFTTDVKGFEKLLKIQRRLTQVEFNPGLFPRNRAGALGDLMHQRFEKLASIMNPLGITLVHIFHVDDGCSGDSTWIEFGSHSATGVFLDRYELRCRTEAEEGTDPRPLT